MTSRRSFQAAAGAIASRPCHARDVRRTLPLLLAVLLMGCLPDLSPWQVGETRTDGAVPTPDASSPRADSSIPGPDGCSPEVTCADGCPLPWVLGAVQDLDSRRACGGRVWRWSVTDRDNVCTCAALDGDGLLDPLPFAIGFVPPSTVILGGQSSVQAIDAASDRVLWSQPIPGRAIDVFPIANPSGQLRVAAASGTVVGERANIIHIFEPAAGTPEQSWFTSADLGIGSFESATVSPYNRQWMRVLKTSGSAAIDFDPWNDRVMNSPAHTANSSGYFLHTISATYSRTFHQTVWTGERTDLPGDPSRVQRVSLVTDEGNNRVGPGDYCREFMDGLEYDVTCDFVHAVPDPTKETATFAICDYGGGQRRVVRIQSSERCETLVEQTAVASDMRLWALALAQSSYWAP